MTWTLTNNGTTRTLADWSITDASLALQHAAPDTLQLTIPTTADPAIHFPARKISLAKDGQTVFQGRLDLWDDNTAADGEAISYRALGPWWYLENLIYQQRWPTYDNDLATGGEYLTNILLGTDADGNPTTLGNAIADILRYAADQGAPISDDFPAHHFPDPAPIAQASGITCAEAILRLIGYTPYTIAHWDYSQCPPRLCLTPRCRLPIRTLTVGTAPYVSHQLAPSSVRPVGVDILWEVAVDDRGIPVTQDTYDAGATTDLRRAIIAESYPPASDTHPFGRVRVTIDHTADPDSPRPTGIARRYWESLPCRLYTGGITLADAECSGPWLGRRINLLGSRPEYATMEGIVMSATHDIPTGTTQLVIGTPDHLTPETFMEQQRALELAFSLRP